MTPGARTPEAIANVIRMKRQQFAGAFVIVEGDTDARFYGGLIDNANCKVQNADNKQKAIKVLETLEEDSFAGVLAIVDADFDTLENGEPASVNLFCTDWHDLECMIFASPALEKVLAEFGSEAKIAKFPNIRETIIAAALPIGCLLWASLKEAWNLRFEGLDFGKFVDSKDLTVNTTALSKTLKNHSQSHHLDETELAAAIQSIQYQNHPPLLVCCGHHLVEILSLGLRRAIGSRNAKEVEAEILERSLRLAYEFAYFAETELFKQIREWEKANQPYRVFPK